MDNNDESYSEEKKESWRMSLRVINELSKSRLDEKVFDGVRTEKIYHGLEMTSSIILDKVFTTICFCVKTQVNNHQ
jgi:hypothetical protein